jgi:fructan beta-fructosidase
MSPSIPSLFLAVSPLLTGALSAGEDLVVDGFEGERFGDWKATGDAFGNAPAAGALNGQMAVTGFQGRGLVNSYHGGDESTGRLVSAPFRIERRYLNLLIGGGGFAGETCMNLLSDGKVLHSATGTNVVPGGSERLEWKTWDLAGLEGKRVTLEIVDARKGTWGHVNVDQIVQSDLPARMDVRKEFKISSRYLVWPVTRNLSGRNRFFLTLDGEQKPLACVNIALSETPDFWVFTDLSDYQGRTITVTSDLPFASKKAWEMVAISETYPGEETLYREPLRPQYHFTSRRGWLNDPNGLLWENGTWHLFYQHNPYNTGWDNMHWGHATSTDLFHWKEKPDALFPDAEGYMYSGSAVLATRDQVGFSIKGGQAMALFYTAEGTRSHVPGIKTAQGLALNEDSGPIFHKFKGNPVVPHRVAENRDPKVFWHEPTKSWVMDLYLDGDEYGIYSSKGLANWRPVGGFHIPGSSECPDLFELPVEGDPQSSRWVAWGANGRYVLGGFDGRSFTPQSAPQRQYFGAAYAGQTYNGAPGGRRVHIGWMWDSRGLEGAPFNLQMTLPMEFSLAKDSKGGLRLHIEPVPEVVSLRDATKEWKDLVFKDVDQDPLADFHAGSFEVEAVIDTASTASEMGLMVFGNVPAIWRKTDQGFSGMEGSLEPVNGRLNLRLFVDTVSMEVFVNGSYTGRYLRQRDDAKPVRLIATGGEARFESLRIHTLRSIWR